MSLSSEPKPSWQSLPCTVTLLTAPLVLHRLSLLWAGQPRGGWLWAARTAVQATSLWKYQGQKDNAFSWDMKKEAALLRWPRHAEVTWLHRVRAVPAASHPALSLAPWRGMGRTAFTTWTCCHSHPDVSCYLTSALSSPFAASSQRRSGPFKNELCAWAVPPPLGPDPHWCPCPGGAQLAQHGRCQLPIQLADGWLGMGGDRPWGWLPHGPLVVGCQNMCDVCISDNAESCSASITPPASRRPKPAQVWVASPPCWEPIFLNQRSFFGISLWGGAVVWGSVYFCKHRVRACRHLLSQTESAVLGTLIH